MDKRARNIGFLLLGILALLFTFEQLTPKPINWRASYTSGDKIPFGAYVLYDQLDELFPESDIELVNTDPISFLERHEDETNGNYIFINDYLGFDKIEVEYLMEFASRGNKVFIATTSVYGAMADSLNLSSSYGYYGYKEDTIRVRMTNASFTDRSYVYTKGSEYKYLESYDTLQTKVLGEVMPFEPYDGFIKELLGDVEPAAQDSEEDIAVDPEEDQEEYVEDADFDAIQALNRSIPQVNFIETTVGDGAIYYNLNPIAFTNYYMIQDGKADYVSEAFSYLNDGPIYFDDYGKAGRKVVTSPMRFVLSQETLSWAYWLATLCVILYFFFAGKREQRIVEVVEPLGNSSVEFTKTIGQLYYQSGDVTGIIHQRINYFLEKVRSKYFVDTQNIDATFIKRLAVKSGKSQNLTEDVFLYINKLRAQSIHNDYELKQLNKRLEAFLKE